MAVPQAAAVAWRYTFALRRGHLAGFLSVLSMGGIALAVALLITVLSVMNGFDREMRERILALVPHLVLHGVGGVRDWSPIREQLLRHPDVTAVRPFAQVFGMLVVGGTLETANVSGVDSLDAMLPGGEEMVTTEARACFAAQAQGGVLLGAELARRLEVQAGDVLQLLVPPSSDIGGRPPRFVELVYCGALTTYTELDQVSALLPLEQVADLAGLDGAVAGFQVMARDLFAVQPLGQRLLLELGPLYYATNWMQSHGNLYAAIQLSRDLVTFLLLSIIAIAAFNVVSSLVLVVLNKRNDIAILRTLGATPSFIASVFLLQGTLIGAVGVALGAALGTALAVNITGLVAAIERVTGWQFLNTDVYPISYLPTDLRVADVLMIVGATMLMCLVASVYPAVRAARLQPARVLSGD